MDPPYLSYLGFFLEKITLKSPSIVFSFVLSFYPEILNIVRRCLFAFLYGIQFNWLATLHCKFCFQFQYRNTVREKQQPSTTGNIYAVAQRGYNQSR